MIATKTIRLQTKGNNDVIDITDFVAAEVAATGVKEGIVAIFVVGSTAGITTLEYEPGLVADLKDAFDRLVPRSMPYRHNSTWNEDNGHSHVRASLLGPSLAVPVIRGRLPLGTWQQIVLVDFDIRPRSREVIVQVVGEDSATVPGRQSGGGR